MPDAGQPAGASGAAAPAARGIAEWIGALRLAALLSLGWVLAAGFAWELFGVFPAALVLVVWVLLLVRFHKAMETLARSITARRQPASEG